MDIYEKSLIMHKEHRGKIEINSKVKVTNKEELSMAYSPGVAQPCREIVKDEENIYKYTSKGNMVVVVTDGSAVLGLGNIGAKAALPVMEGKSILFKNFANIDSFPLCLDTTDVDEIVHICKMISPSVGGINLEDISAPRCVEIERRLKGELDIPVFHDDQHGTAIITIAALINACKLTNKDHNKLKVVINGAGAAGSSIANMVHKFGVADILVLDREGILNSRRKDLDFVKKELIQYTNRFDIEGGLLDAMVGADVFIGVSVGGVVSKDMIKVMNDNPFIFAMANPEPEIMPELAKEAGAKIIGTGRSDYPNQINNVLAFPGIFRGALDVGAKEINDDMKLAAALAIAEVIKEDELTYDYVVPSPFDERVVKSVANAVADAAKKSGVVRNG